MLFGLSVSSVSRKASLLSEPSTWMKQCVVWPMPLGRILSRNIALITVLLPFEVLEKKNKDKSYLPLDTPCRYQVVTIGKQLFQLALCYQFVNVRMTKMNTRV